MAFTDWFPALSGTVFGVAGLVTAAWTTISGRKHERRLAADREEWARETGHEQWLRDRRVEAYIGFLNLAHRVESVVQTTLQALYDHETEPEYLWDPGAPPERELRIAGDELRLTRVLVAVYGSTQIRGLVEEWHAIGVETLTGTAWCVQIGQSDTGGVAAHLPRLAELRAEIGSLISGELHGAGGR